MNKARQPAAAASFDLIVELTVDLTKLLQMSSLTPH